MSSREFAQLSELARRLEDVLVDAAHAQPLGQAVRIALLSRWALSVAQLEDARRRRGRHPSLPQGLTSSHADAMAYDAYILEDPEA